MINIKSFNIERGKKVDEVEYKFTNILFSAGEFHPVIELNKIDNNKIIEISARLNSNDDIVKLMLLNNIIDNNFKNHSKHLKLFYTMFSRQDRAANKGEAESLKVFCELINNMKFDKVTTYDNHSEVTNALLNNNTEISQEQIFSKFSLNKETINYVISPDAGANKKSFRIAQLLGVPMIQADKIRDTQTGEITKTIVYSEEHDLKEKNVLIVDDICDGGRTVIEIAKILNEKQVNIIDCYFTHGIFSKGLDILFDNHIDFIYTTDSIILTDIKEHFYQVLCLNLDEINE